MTTSANTMAAGALELADQIARLNTSLLGHVADLIAVVNTLLPGVDAQRLTAEARAVFASAQQDVPAAVRALPALRERNARAIKALATTRAVFERTTALAGTPAAPPGRRH
jgi:hypothetical protein